MKTLKEAIESTDRCILMFEPTRGWATTNLEGQQWDDLRWSLTAIDAVQWGIASDSVFPDGSELALIDTVQRSGQYWVCEWWHGPNGEGTGEWLRPFEHKDAIPF